ncbi:MAG TPA: hypothetical protein VMT15_06375 [Bryobacteraceae bacterium]|nr:hypothetical protein [Bryobacteraceae bacterium]
MNAQQSIPMETKRALSILMFWIGVSMANPSASAQEGSRIFILEVPQSGLLCGYTTEREWAKIPQEKNPTFVAVVDSTSGIVSSILVERLTEDTAIYDEYSIDRNGNVRQLKRKLDVIPDRITREETWTIRGGSAVKTSESWMEYKTHRPIDPDKDLADLGKTPIMLRARDFPFSLLVADRHPERWLGGTRCVPGNMDKLEWTQK